MYRPIIGGAKCIVANLTKILGGRPTLQRPTHQWPSFPMGSIGSALSSPSGSGAEPRTQLHFAALYARKTHLVAAVLVKLLVIIEMSGKMKANPGSGRIWYGYLRHINIIVVQTGKLIFVRSKIAAPLNFAALFGRTPRTCLRPALTLYSSSIVTMPLSITVSEI